MHTLNKMVRYAFTKNDQSNSFRNYNESFDISSYKEKFDNSKIFEPDSNTVYSFQTFAYSSDMYGPTGNIEYKTGIEKDDITFSHIIVYKSNVYLLPEVFFLTQDGQKEYAETLDMWELVQKAKNKIEEGNKLYHIECIWPSATSDSVTVTMSQTVYIDDDSVKRLHNDQVVNIPSSKFNKLEEVIVPKFEGESLISKFIQYVYPKT